MTAEQFSVHRREYLRLRYACQRERVLKYQAAWRRQHADEVTRRLALYKQRYPVKRKLIQALADAKRWMRCRDRDPGPVRLADLLALLETQKNQCAVCACAFVGCRWELDHIVAKDNGGSNLLTNLQFLCQRCNRSKSVREKRPHTLAA